MLEQIRNDLSEFMIASNKTQAQIAKETGFSSSVISLFIKGTYTGNNEEVAETIGKYLEMGKKRLDVHTEGFYEGLHNTIKVLFAAEYTHQHCELAIIHGSAGSGKTTALKRYAENNAGVLFITANASSRTTKTILYLITEALGRKPETTEFMMHRNLVEYLKDSKRLIIIDEADHLCTRALQAVRSLNDEAKVGIILSGNDIIYQQMYGRGSMQYDQLRTRTIRIKVENSYTVEEIANIFPEIEEDKECLAYLLKIACKESLRTAKKCYNLAQLLNQSQGNRKMTVSQIRQVQRRYFSGII